MRSLTKEEVLEWLAARPELSLDEKDLGFASGFEERLHFHPPTGEGQLAHFARLLTCLHHAETSYSGALLWFTEWGVWNDYVEDIGYKAISMLRGLPGELARFKSSPGQLFKASEALQAAAFLLWPIVIGWDAYYCPFFDGKRIDYFVKVSHDAYINIYPASAAARLEIQELFSETAFRETKH